MSTEIYLGKERFQSEEEARRRRTSLGAAAQRRMEWALREAHKRMDSGYCVDLACGNGRHTRSLLNERNRVIAADISEPMLKTARKLVRKSSNVDFVRLEAERLPLPDKSVDVVFSIRFLHHIPTRVIRGRILSEMIRVSRKGVIITIKARYTPEHLATRLKDLFRGRWKDPHRHFISEKEVQDVAMEHGWRISGTHSTWGPLTATRVLVLDPASP